MKVVIFCGGLGTRLPEETAVRPKPMVEIGKRPIIWHIMKTYAHHGFKEFVLCLGYKGEMIKEYFDERANKEDWDVIPVDTGARAEKGARLKRVEERIDGDTFMVTYGDGVANVDIRKLLAFHRDHGKLVTMTGVHPSSSFGEIRHEGGKVMKFIEKPQFSTSLVNGGFLVLNRKILNRLEDKNECDFEEGILTKLVAEGQATGDCQVMVREHDGWWHCMDTYRDMLYLNDLWSKGQAPWKVWK